MKRVAALTSACAALLAAASALAALPPFAYEEMQRDAPEDIEIEVLHVGGDRSAEDRRRAAFLRLEIVATARVSKVRRSALNLRPGDRVTLRYETEHHRVPYPGPGYAPVVTAGSRYRAFLAGPADALRPVALGASFVEPLPDGAPDPLERRAEARPAEYC